MDDAVHGAAVALERLLEGVQRARDMLVKRIGYQDVVVFGIAIVGTCTGKVIDSIVNMLAVARPFRGRAGRGRDCGVLKRLVNRTAAAFR